MKNVKSVLVGILILLASSHLFSQNKWSAELRPNLNFPTSEIDNSDIKTGFGFEMAIGYRFMEHLGAYVGWGYTNFQIEDSDTDFDETGYTFGFQFNHPIGTSQKLSYLIRAGGIYNHIELEDDDGNLIDDSRHGFGWEVGTGLNYDLGSNWHLRPQIGYRALSRDLKLGAITKNIDINYVAFGVGIVKRF